LEPNGSLVLIPNLLNSAHDLHPISKSSFLCVAYHLSPTNDILFQGISFDLGHAPCMLRESYVRSLNELIGVVLADICLLKIYAWRKIIWLLLHAIM